MEKVEGGEDREDREGREGREDREDREGLATVQCAKTVQWKTRASYEFGTSWALMSVLS